jgi:hypothetical protein
LAFATNVAFYEFINPLLLQRRDLRGKNGLVHGASECVHLNLWHAAVLQSLGVRANVLSVDSQRQMAFRVVLNNGAQRRGFGSFDQQNTKAGFVMF